ncbi:MAG: PIG-L family deacetylase [Acidobacteria bacterium]|nr:PIG-L family deacetylase [Acidobacteriota bacterium]
MSICVHLWLMILLVSAANAQVRPVNDYGVLGLAQLLNRLQTTGSVMMIGAHPDDEDSALLAYLARGENARTAYLSLTRGDGGQNIIGPELFESLGVIRTEELLQARRLDGAEQYFARAFDYGFSKTLEEAKSKWPEDVIKCDVVRAIRLFRPLVVISRFTGTPRDGHGQHQYAGYITPIAVKAAADPAQCTTAGTPWQVKKFYVEGSFGDNSEPTLRINTGAYDPLLGRSYAEIALEGRSLHRSQGEGRIEVKGDQFSSLNLVGAAKDLREKDIFDGVDTTISGIANIYHTGGAPVTDYTRRQLQESQQALEAAARDFSLTDRQKVISSLVKSRRALADLEASHSIFSGPPERQIAWDATRKNEAGILAVVEQRVGLFWPSPLTAAIGNAAGIQIDALADSETVVPGGDLMVSVKTFGRKEDMVKISDISLSSPGFWTVVKTDPPTQANAAYNPREVGTANAVFNVKVAADAPLTEPYWLRSERKGDLFAWPDTASQTLPFDPPQLIAHVKVNIGGTEITLDQPVQYRFADPARGEVRREINVVPPVSLTMQQKLLVVPVSNSPQTRRLDVTATKNVCKPTQTDGTLTIRGNSPGWKAAALTSAGTLAKCGDKATESFNIMVPANAKPGTYSFTAQVEGSGFHWADTMNTVAYPHIQTHRYYTPAEANVLVLDLKTTPANIGYIMGSGDEVPEAIRQMGMNVTMLGEQDLSSGDLSKFDTIVVGIRASETRSDLVANNQRLLDYAKAGGNVIFQYQRNNWTALAPFPVNTQDKQGTTAGTIARVVDENAKVTILDPANPIFNTPNKITDADFAGWVQERNAYNLVTFDPQYTPLLESHDAGEQENKGGLVIAKLGKGNWAYCSYSFFRQLPAGVPGAYRLFANLLSLPRAK